MAIRPVRSPHLLLTGRPAAGKTTVIRRLRDLLRAADVPLGGFVTEEVRRAGQRVGFLVEDVASGARVSIADVESASGDRVGRYGVDVAAFDSVALPALDSAGSDSVLLVDEIGRMELLSSRFVGRLDDILDRPGPLLATVHTFSHPVTDRIIARLDVEIIEITPASRDALPGHLVSRLGATQPGTGS